MAGSSRASSRTRPTRPTTATPRGPRSCRTSPAGGSITSSPAGARSEEHTSELQSQSNLVCRLLLEKKINALHTKRHNLFQALDSFIDLLMEAKDRGLR